ncbi:MAG TPA: hypothetical protein VFT98_02340, partial [Myxococcota bacterium]|nr:hypothetical protein [Myxococcota bacterium]
YYFRGILNENDGLIAQPWGELYANLYSSEDGLIRDVTAGVGVWLSIHSEETLATNSPHSLYEADYYPLVSMDLAGGFNLLTIYYFYDSPNGAWDEAVQELNFKLSYDDSESLGLSPWVNFAIETHSTSLGGSSGTGVQFGIAPTFYEGDLFSLGASAEVGLAIDDYYEGVDSNENTFGYANIGLGVGVPITDTWSAAGTFKYFFFGDDLETVNNGDGDYPVGMVSLTAEF